MTMKMINSTRRTSISGVTFMSDIAPPLFPPPIPIAISSSPLAAAALQFGSYKFASLLLRWRRAGIVRSLRQKTKLAYAGRTDSIDRIHHLAVVGALIGPHEDLFAQLVLELR